MKYRSVIFDFDGTLADSATWFLDVINELADEMGFRRIQPEDQELIRGYSAGEVMKHLRVPMWKLPKLMQQTRKRALRDAESIRLFPGCIEMLGALRSAGISVGIVSSNAEDTIRKIMGPTSAAQVQYFSCGASLFGKAAKLRTLIRRSSIPASESIYVGDEIRDATAAKEVGMDFAAVAWGFASVTALQAQSPAMFFQNMGDLSKRLTS